MNKKYARLSLMILVIGFALMAPAAFAADGEAVNYGKLGGPIGASIALVGALGIGRIGGSAVEAMARQPEMAGQISTAMLITAAMIEGAMLFAVVVGLLASL